MGSADISMDVASPSRDGCTLSGGGGNTASNLLLERGPHIRFVLFVLAQTFGSPWGSVAVHPFGLRGDTKRMPVRHRKIWRSVNHAVKHAYIGPQSQQLAKAS